jgi:hypothetical protein
MEGANASNETLTDLIFSGALENFRVTFYASYAIVPRMIMAQGDDICFKLVWRVSYALITRIRDKRHLFALDSKARMS